MRKGKVTLLWVDEEEKGLVRTIGCPTCHKLHIRRNKETYHEFMTRVRIHSEYYHPFEDLDWLKTYPDP